MPNGKPYMLRHRSLLLLLAASASCVRSPATTASAPVAISASQALPASSPFASASTLAFQAPDFGRIHNGDYQPAFEEGMRQHLAEIDAIANNPALPTFDNTILAMERSGELLTRVSKVFNGVVGANTNDTLQKVQEVEAGKLAQHFDAVYLNAKLFQRVKAVYDQRDAQAGGVEEKALLARYYRDFVRSGALLSEADKAKLRALNLEESKLTTDFQNHLLAATKAGAVVVSDRAELEGLDEGQVAALAQAAKERGMEGKWVIVLQNTTQHPLQASLKNRALRQRLFVASTTRAEHGDANDTRAIIARYAQLRAERAALLGYPSYAAYALETQGAKTPEQAIGLLTGLAAPATAKARDEIAKMQALIDRQGGGFKLAPWDWQYYAEQVRKAEYDLDNNQIKPYFELDHVLKDGVFFAAHQLYGLTFRQRTDLPVYQPDVRVFEVFDADGKSMALFYCDYFKRDNKNGGAWMDNFVDQSGMTGLKPVVYNVANFQKPAPGQPALLSFDDVTTMFHEFGHALHGMFSSVQYPTFSGSNVPRDFVEFPSQFNEHWALEPTVFANFAKHYQTGAPMPQALVDKIKRARTFNQGFATTEYLAASLLDLAWHTQSKDAPKQDVGAFEAAALQRFGVAMPEVPPRYRTPYFAHIWANSYAAGYYAYMWSELIDDDAYAWFTENGGMTRANGQRFRDMILSRGGVTDAATLYRAFRGRDPKIDALLEQRGLKPPE
ncbi:MAG: Dipeptidyl carboxypeptidase Dcp [Gemmatimonadetes bacterium]|nr:Dipeptidyl carboxypeptidase Dcp [Gemmatimonadota bacterium]